LSRREEIQEVADAIIQCKEQYYAAITDAHAAGFPVGRLVGICGYSAVKYVLGSDAVEPWRKERGYTEPQSVNQPAQRPGAPSPAFMASIARRAD
jgi:hypothetical protein